MFLHIVQPVVPTYRVVFFEKLNARICLNLYCSKVDQNNVQSVPSLNTNEYVNSFDLVLFLRGSFIWQKKIKFQMKVDDALVVNGNPRFLSNIPLLLKAKLHGIKTIWWGHGWSSTSKTYRAKIRMLLTRLLADRVLLYTDKERDAYIKQGFPAHKVFALNNGIDTTPAKILKEKIKKTDIDNFITDKELQNKRLILFVGRLTEKSRASLLIQAIKLLPEDAHIVFVGDGVEKSRLVTLSESENIDERVTFTGAIFEDETLAYWMLASQIFVYPGAVGLSLLHAFSYGLPAVIHSDDKQQMPEHAAFKEGYNGFYFERENVKSLASSITKLLESPDLKNMSSNALKTVQDTYNIDDMVERFIKAVS